jgi:hypothetical protein
MPLRTKHCQAKWQQAAEFICQSCTQNARDTIFVDKSEPMTFEAFRQIAIGSLESVEEWIALSDKLRAKYKPYIVQLINEYPFDWLCESYGF